MSEVDYAAMRSAMVESQLRTSDVSDPRVIAAMAHVPREDHVPSARRASAYIDRSVPIGNGRAINPPLATGRLLNAAAIEAGDKVLLIGAAGGYCAAVLSAMGAHVVAVEQDDFDGDKRKELPGVTWVKGPLVKGAAKNGPYDVLLIDGAVEQLPDSLCDQITDGARVVTGIVDHGVTRLHSGRKVGGSVGLTCLADLEMAVLPGFARPTGFSF
ncbi:MAG: protein-L-isoaspartate O-methyltransferase [Sphingobium sp.]